MKLTQSFALLGVAARGVQPFAARHVQRALNDTHSTVVMITSTYLVSEICTDIARCPPYTTEAETSTVYTTDTTTICVLSSTPPAYGIPVTSIADLSVPISTYPTGFESSFNLIPSSSMSGYPSISAPLQTSGLLMETASSSIYTVPSIVSSQQSSSKSFSVTSTPSTSNWYIVSIMTLSGIISVPGVVTATSAPTVTQSSAPIATPPVSSTNSVGASYTIPFSSSSTTSASTGYLVPSIVSTTWPFASSSAVPSVKPTSQPGSYPGSITPSSSAGTSKIISGSIPVYSSTTPSISSYMASYLSASSSTDTHTVPTSHPAAHSGTSSAMSSQSTGSSSSGYIVPSSSSVPPLPAYPSSSSVTVPSTYLAVTTGTPGYIGSSLPASSGSTVLDSTILLTSYQTQMFTSYMAVSSSPSTSGNYTETSYEVPTYIRPSTSAGLTGSGYPYPSISTNGSITAPTPSLIEVPINTGLHVGARGRSLAAIAVLVALANMV